MKKIVVATDSFKGTLSAAEICGIAHEEIHKVFPECRVIQLPMADGGEGTVDTLIYGAEGKKYKTIVGGPLREDVEASFAILKGGILVVEVAAAAGLPLVGEKMNPMETTTYGVGELILKALSHSPKQIVIGLGGSATNDGGCGLAAALGVEFFNAEGKTFIPVGGTLSQIKKISMEHVDARIKDIPILAMCDVENPMFGPNGAAFIFAPQKGADSEMVEILDQELRFFSDKLIECKFDDVSQMPGGGAAGALGAGLCALFGAKLVSGIDMLLDILEFDKNIEGADLVITGEGRIDGQSTSGKVLTGICSRAKKQNISVCVISGQSVDEQLHDIYEFGVAGVFTINRKAMAFEEAAPLSKQNLKYTIRNIMEYTKAIQSNMLL